MCVCVRVFVATQFSAGWLVPTTPKYDEEDWERMVGYSTPVDHDHDHHDFDGSENGGGGGVQRV